MINQGCVSECKKAKRQPGGVRMRKIILAASVVAVVALAAQACTRTVTVRGQLVTGTSDSAIYSLDPDCCVFLTDSEVASSIFKRCGLSDECEVQCELNANRDIVRVYKVRKVDVNVEPSAREIKSAACSVSSVKGQDCDDVDSRLGVEIVRMNESSFNNTIVWNVEYILYRRDEMYSKGVRIDSGVVKIVKSGDGWKYFRD